MSKISVLLSDAEDERFTAYCQEKGFKKSTLLVRLIRDHLDREGYAKQRFLALNADQVHGSTGKKKAVRRQEEG